MARKLTTILAADVAGYSRLMEQDERGTIAALGASRAVFASVIAAHGGRVFGGAGDSIVAEFASAVEAVQAAILIQDELSAAGHTDTGVAPMLPFRIGINIGDVVIEGDNLLGDGVNVAARIEALAEPGGIYISRAVYEQVRGKIDVNFQSQGRQTVKNIAEPISVYRVAPNGGSNWTPLKVSHSFANRVRHPLGLPALVIIVLVVVAGAYWYLIPRPLPPHGHVLVAVMPFASLTDDPATQRLANGLTEDIITDLSRFAHLEIVASNTTNAYKDKANIVHALGEDLDVSYLLQGTIQSESARLRVSAQLIGVPRATVLWSQRWDRPTIDALVVQSELAEEVAAALGSAEVSGAVTANEIRKARSRSATTLAAYDYYLLALEALDKFTKEARSFGLEAATKAIGLDPKFARAYAIRARIRFNTTHDGADYEQVMRDMEADARKAVDLDPTGPEPRVALAKYYLMSGRNLDAEAELKAALKFNPANITVIKFAAAVFAYSGHPEEAADLADKVLRLDPLATAGTLMTIKDAYFFARRFEEEVAVISRVPAEARSKGARLFLPMSLAFLGRHDDAQRARAELLKYYPDISAELLLNQGWAFEREADKKLFLDGFAAIDVPVCATTSTLATLPKPIRLRQCSG